MTKGNNDGQQEQEQEQERTQPGILRAHGGGAVKLASVTMAGGHREAEAPDAILSVQDWVDLVVLLDTTNAEGSIRRIKSICRRPVHVAQASAELRREWCCGRGRNEALDAAAAAGADWAIEVDTDERIQLRGEDVRALLDGLPDDVSAVCMWDAEHGELKAKAFRLPRRGAYEEVKIHEHWQCANLHHEFPRARYVELPKSEAARENADKHVIEGAREQEAKDPENSRWPYYLGDTLRARCLRRAQQRASGGPTDFRPEASELEESLAAYDRAIALEQRDEFRSYMLVHSALSCGMLGRAAEGIARCGQALATWPGMAEAAHVAALLEGDRGNLDFAIWWARIAVSLGHLRGCAAEIPRSGFNDPLAQWDGPFRFLEILLAKAGRPAEAAEAGRLAHCAQWMRLREGDG